MQKWYNFIVEYYTDVYSTLTKQYIDGSAQEKIMIISMAQH